MLIDGRVLADLAAATRFGDVRLLDETDSTNRLVAELAAGGAPEGLVVVAAHQTAGRGRLDRTWEERPGDGLLASVLLRPEGLAMERWHLLTAAVALAARAACRRVAAVEPDVKWPNDLLLGRAKLAGILAESGGGAVVVGMGLNVHGGPPGAAVLDEAAARRVDEALLLDTWLRELDGRLGDWDRLAAEYRSGCATVGMRVAVEMARGERLEGTARDVDELGRLVVEQAGGETTAVAVGDVTHLWW